jgi:biotin carboxyl carrier protein
MSKVFKTSVNNTFDFEISNEDISNLDVVKTSDTKFHVLYENKSYEAEISKANFNSKSYEIKINNNTYHVNIFNELDLLIKKMGFTHGKTKNINSIKAPMPGLILDISVTIGQEVKENDTLLILEAMKMENSITSPRDGVIKTISVTKNDTVKKNQLLIEFE